MCHNGNRTNCMTRTRVRSEVDFISGGRHQAIKRHLGSWNILGINDTSVMKKRNLKIINEKSTLHVNILRSCSNQNISHFDAHHHLRAFSIYLNVIVTTCKLKTYETSLLLLSTRQQCLIWISRIINHISWWNVRAFSKSDTHEHSKSWIKFKYDINREKSRWWEG